MTFDSTRLAVYKNDAEYVYKQGAKYEENLLSKLFTRFLNWLSEATGITFGYRLFQLIKYLLIFSAVYLMIRFFTNSTHGGLVKKSEKNFEDIDTVLVDADMSALDLSKLVEQAEQQGDYRLAVRFSYLKLLRNLDDNELIHWKAEKTNSDFIAELNSTTYGESFKDITRLYEYAWYGEFELSEEAEYLESKHQFDKLFQNLSS